MPTSHDDLASRLDAIADELRDRALDVLREAAEAGAVKAPQEEKLLARARRAVEKAAGLLRGADSEDEL